MKTLKILIENDVKKRTERFFNKKNEDLNQYVNYEYQVADDFEPFDHTYVINGKHYSPCIFNIKDRILIVEEFEIKGNEEDETFENVLTCPVCNYVYHDCWEFSRDYNDNLECPMCKSILEYQREYTVTYTTKVKKLSKPYKLIKREKK